MPSLPPDQTPDDQKSLVFDTTAWKRGDWNCSVSASYELTSSSKEFQLKEVLRAEKNNEEVFRREQTSTIKRELL